MILHLAKRWQDYAHLKQVHLAIKPRHHCPVSSHPSAVMQHRMMKEAQRAMAPWMGGQPVYNPMSHASSQMNPLLYSGTQTFFHVLVTSPFLWTSHFISPHCLSSFFSFFSPLPRICFRKKHSFKGHATPASSILGLQYAPSECQR